MNINKWKKFLYLPILIATGAVAIYWYTTNIILKERFKEERTKALLAEIKTNIDNYRLICGRLPISLEITLAKNPPVCPSYEPLTLPRSFRDNWENPIVYYVEGEKYRLLSAGNEWLEVGEEGNVITVIKPK